MADLSRRLRALESAASPPDFPAWPLEDQIEEGLEKVQFYQRFHADGKVLYSATDAELNALGVAHAYQELQGEGEILLPHSGTVIRLSLDRSETPDTFEVSVSGAVTVEDLPEVWRGFLKRMDSENQPDRDRRLYELWRQDQDRGEGGS